MAAARPKPKAKPDAAASWFAAANRGKVVTVDLGDDELSVQIRRLTTGEHTEAVVAATTQTVDDETGAVLPELDPIELCARFIALATVEPALRDLDEIRALPMDLFKGLAGAIAEHSRLNSSVGALQATFRDEA